MNEPLKSQPFRVLEGSREKLLGRRRVVPAWQAASETAAESELRELRQVSMPRQVELPGVKSVETEPAELAGMGIEKMAGKKKRARLSAVQIGELRRRSLTDESAADLMAEFGISSSTFYTHAKAAKKLAAKEAKKMVGKTAKKPAPRPEKVESELPARAELMGVLEALARFVDARVDRRLAEAFGRLGGK